MYYCLFFACYVKGTVGRKEMHFAIVVAEWSFLLRPRCVRCDIVVQTPTFNILYGPSKMFFLWFKIAIGRLVIEKMFFFLFELLTLPRESCPSNSHVSCLNNRGKAKYGQK